MNEEYRSPYIKRYKGEVARIRMMNPNVHAAIGDLESHNQRLLEALNRANDALSRANDALRFYADPENYKQKLYHGSYWSSPIAKEEGSKAREALKETE